MSQLERIVWIDRTIRAVGGVTAGQVADSFEVSERQAKRDFEYLKYRLNAPLAYSRKVKRYVYRGPFEDLDFFDELAFLDAAFMRALADDSAYLPFLSDLFKDALAVCAGPYQKIAARVRYELPDRERPSGSVVQAICRAMKHSVLIKMDYTDSKGAVTKRRVLPLRLINYGGKWYCLARDAENEEFRTFALSRIKEATVTAEWATQPDDIVVEGYVNASYGIFKGKPLGRGILRFSGGAARAVRDQVWHRKQTIAVVQEEPEPQIELSLPVHDWTELLGRALRCGGQCEVIGPPEFRARWVGEIRALAALAGIMGNAATGTTGVPSAGV